MSWLTRVYATLIRISIAEQLQYRAANAIWVLGAIVEPIVYWAVWSAAAHDQGGSIGGRDSEDLAAYYIAFALANHLTLNWVMYDFQLRIESGQLSFQLLRPLHPIHQDLADNVGYKLVMLVLLVPVLAALACLLQPRFAPSPLTLAALVPALVLAFALRFALEWALGLAAFWTTRIVALNQAYFAVLMFFSGRVAPTELLPGALGELAWWLPFRWMIGFPVELATGWVSPREAALGIAMQGAWLVAALLLVRALWSAAARRYSAVGS
jgi:ABC-2 type transport system permease protein